LYIYLNSSLCKKKKDPFKCLKYYFFHFTVKIDEKFKFHLSSVAGNYIHTVRRIMTHTMYYNQEFCEQTYFTKQITIGYEKMAHTV